MRKHLIHKGLACLLAGWLLLFLSMPWAWAAEDAVVISSVEDLLEFSKNCALDAWSRGKTVRLAADLSLAEVDFSPVPIFSGIFDGQGHTISGLRLTAAGSSQGFFRYLEPAAVVRNLTVTGIVSPEGSRSSIGGIAGVNSGTIQSCAFRGTVQGRSAVGGIVGRNNESGQVIDCAASGYVYGENATGGIAGRNLGILLKCENRAGVNLTEAGDSSGLMDLDAGASLEERITSGGEEDDDAYGLLNSYSDTGGIVGCSSGVVQSCVNTGAVGYPHVGYNAGGIAGRQSGYLAGCVNSGEIRGRKDVGGIVGQAEPLLALNPGRDALERLRAELDALDRLIDRALDDAQSTGDDISARLAILGDYTGDARDSSKRLLDRTSGFVDENIDKVNTLTADITNALDKISPALDDLSDIGGRLERLSDHLGEAMGALGEALDIGDDAMADIRAAVSRLRQSGSSLREASKALREALDAFLKGVISGDEAAQDEAIAEMKDCLPKLSDAFGNASLGLDALRKALEGTEHLPAAGEILPSLDDLKASLEQIAGALDQIGNLLPDRRADWSKVREAFQRAVQALSGASDGLNSALSSLQSALENAGPLSGKLGDALGELENASSSAATIGRLLRSAFRTISDAADDLTGDGPMEFSPLGEAFRKAGDDLFDALAGLTGEMESLNDLIQDAGDTLTADLRAISRQFNTVFDVLLDALTDLQGGVGETDYIQDTSDEDIAATREGKVTDCRNTGLVEGDRNVGGIVGTMSIEFDLDPEDDAADRFTFGSTYETKAVLQSCVNQGTVTAKKDCVGGLAGRMDLGTILDCQGYGAVSSTGGDYVGGIVGLADATVRNCWAKAALSGRNYIGGIAGWASSLRDCAAIATIMEGVESLGAIAGDVEESGVLSGNRFVDTGIAGVDGISYTGRAEPAAFAALQQLPDAPAEFTAFTLTLLAEGETVARIPFYYGDDLSLIALPEVPVQEGSYGVWGEFDTSGAKSDVTVEAVYAPWITLVASEELEGELALALAEGQFTGDAVLHVTDSDQTPPQDGEVCVWQVSLTGTEPMDQVPLRLLSPGGGKAMVWQFSDGQWQKVDAVRNGSYLLLTMEGAQGIFCIQNQSGSLWMLLLAVAGAGVLLLLVFLGRQWRRRGAAKPPKAAASQ